MSNIDHSITVNTFACAKHTYGFATHNIRWGEWVEFITSGHEIREDKDGPMFNGAMFDNVEGGDTIHRSEQNVVGYSLLILDYDGPLKIKHAKQLFADTEYVGYTSYRHNHPEKNHVDCFRIVVPLRNRVEKEEITSRRTKVLIDWAGGLYPDPVSKNNLPIVDRSTFSHSRSFYTPSVSAAQVQFAEAWHNAGELFDITTLALDPVEKFEKGPVVETYHSDEFKQRVVDALKQINGLDYQEWLVTMLAMCSNDYSYLQFLDATNESNSSTTANLWRSTQAKVGQGTTRGMGVLVNQCKKYGTWKTDTEQRIETLQKRLAAIRGTK